MPQFDSLTQAAIESLHFAAAAKTDGAGQLAEARSVWQPDTWLLQRCWQMLAEAGCGVQALSVAALAEARQPLSPIHALYKVAQQARNHPQVAPLVEHELAQLHAKLFDPHIISDPQRQMERLLHAAAAAALIHQHALALSYLEKLDQTPRASDRIYIQPDLRHLLFDTVARIGLHPLTSQLITTAARHYSDSGAQFLQQIADFIGREAAHSEPTGRHKRLLDRCVAALRSSVLIGLHSRRIAATVMAQAGLVEDVLEQLSIIATIQDAHRETGHVPRGGSSQYLGGGREGENPLLRQVTRPRANADVDFQVYTLQNAAKVLPIQRISPMQRVALSNSLADLGLRSDGWTAASAAATLIRLGGIEDAINTVDQIAANDPTRSEGVIALVTALLENGDEREAEQQTQKALAWARSLPERTPERATVWGLAQAYLAHDRPQLALRLLGAPPESTWFERLTNLLRGHGFESSLGDAELRNGRLRLQGLLQLQQNQRGAASTLSSPASSPSSLPNGENALGQPDLDVGAESVTEEIGNEEFGNEAASASALPTDAAPTELSPAAEALLDQLIHWAPQLLEGEALVNFCVDGLLVPLLAAGKVRHAWGLLPLLSQAVRTLHGSKHAHQVDAVLHPFADYLRQIDGRTEPEQINAMRKPLADFMLNLWKENARQGIWQAVYGIDGSLYMLLTLEGAEAVMAVADAAANDGALWGQN
ncbi:MAG: hypothetical protein KDE47_16780 [Caldilineaceae bacterium]|nr:hypothetical protein [Caldilineaceae bacterium]